MIILKVILILNRHKINTKTKITWMTSISLFYSERWEREGEQYN